MSSGRRRIPQGDHPLSAVLGPNSHELNSLLSPLHWEHVHLVGTYSFDEQPIDGEPRPLRGEG